MAKIMPMTPKPMTSQVRLALGTTLLRVMEPE